MTRTASQLRTQARRSTRTTEGPPELRWLHRDGGRT
jgi:hypothetical protein